MGAQSSEKLVFGEAEKRREFYSVLEELDGFRQLPPLQQRLIRLSLYISQRAERALGQYPEEKQKHSLWNGFLPHNVDSKYRQTVDHIWYWYCTAAVAALEAPDILQQEAVYGEYFDEVGFYDKIYHDWRVQTLRHLEQFKDVLRSYNKFPVVLDIMLSNSPDDTPEKGMHTALILGFNSKNELIVWEKFAGGAPYRIIPIEKVFETYQERNYTWGFRFFQLR